MNIIGHDEEDCCIYYSIISNTFQGGIYVENLCTENLTCVFD